MKRLARILNKNHISSEQEKVFKLLSDVLFPIAAIVIGIGFGCGWHLDTLTRFSDAFISQLQFTELAF